MVLKICGADGVVLRAVVFFKAKKFCWEKYPKFRESIWRFRIVADKVLVSLIISQLCQITSQLIVDTASFLFVLRRIARVDWSHVGNEQCYRQYYLFKWELEHSSH